jgi:hypothetical protein
MRLDRYIRIKELAIALKEKRNGEQQLEDLKRKLATAS